MPEIIPKERTAYLASYTFFTRDVYQYENMSFSQLYLFHKTLSTSYIHSVTIAMFCRTAFL